MTNRELCERILEILVQRGGYESHIDVYQDLRNLILDLAAPETETGEMETFEAKSGTAPTCPKCGAFASPSINFGEWWCPKHGVFHESKSAEPKCEEDTK